MSTAHETLAALLRKAFPHGHYRFVEIAVEECDLHSRKNHDYAAGGDPLGNFRRVAAILALYPGLDLNDPAIVAMIYALKQLDAYLWLKSNKHTPAVEGLVERLRDVAVYARLVRIMEEHSKTGG
jgi:hypothetical protein